MLPFPAAADEFLLLDLREPKNCEAALSLEDGRPSTGAGQAFDEVYQLAAAICRKVAEAEDSGTIEVWGDGTAIRSYTYVSDMVDGIYTLVQSDPSTGSGQSLEGAVNIGCPQYVTVDELVAAVIEVSGKEIHVKHVDGPVGVHSRNFSNARIYSLGWEAKVFLKEGISLTYPWIEAQVKTTQEGNAD